ncbi:MAG: hypothetical protein LBG92_04095 [Prevotellaceae bacterium]|jgi:hypothetical protein|nr:hypothetical protein [Prevotellaceae bacterium]
MYHTLKNIAKKKLLTIPFFDEFGTIFVERERERERERESDSYVIVTYFFRYYIEKIYIIFAVKVLCKTFTAKYTLFDHLKHLCL